ncbi:phytochromobilin:ferredoxin oxidoreductase, chloroplastic isoform X3 [Vigna radiata var. radiata]|uniref:Phytochromobilin:ferredoxin oxidoreductase, chloroplastic isoform X3 n=1 Tax=Vigna radiata var. radiata TaxID=3916 RepID=A0A3Q0F4E7_VIGRR|nr:phytochromobilin:ferredoxin oxidoreductase, chloroplastic isoform X3 [Vigna radiata var. radiata]
MEFRIGGSPSSTFCLQSSLLPPLKTVTTFTRDWGRRRSTCIQSFSVSYHKFVEFALDETRRHIHLNPSPLQEKFSSMNSKDGKGMLSMLSFEATKIRLLRSLIIETETMQLFPWGGKLTSESIKFFSPIVIWTKFTSNPQKYDILYAAFRDYYKVWLELICKSVKETDESQVVLNLEAQHRYLTWRVEKDPGQGVLKKLIGDTLAKDLLRNFLFNGVEELGSKTFYDYFPHYCTQEGMLNKKGNIVGKSFENRPWDARGEFIGE